MMMCSTGLADCVQLMAQRKANFNNPDRNDRTCLQMARQAQGKEKKLYTWLIQNVPGIEDGHGQGRAWEDRRQGSYSVDARTAMGPRQHMKGQDKGGYAPQAAESHGEGKGRKGKRPRTEDAQKGGDASPWAQPQGGGERKGKHSRRGKGSQSSGCYQPQSYDDHYRPSSSWWSWYDREPDCSPVAGYEPQ